MSNMLIDALILTYNYITTSPHSVAAHTVATLRTSALSIPY